jgi:5-methylcytosine-specific restriction endonuclease McrA
VATPKQKKEWTDARWHAFVVSVLRSGTRKYPPKYETLNEAKTEKKTNTKTGRIAQHYMCSGCAGEFPATQVQVDHIEPVVSPQTGFTTWDDFVRRLFCGKENLQVLCKTCHSLKSAEEKGERNRRKKSSTN